MSEPADRDIRSPAFVPHDVQWDPERVARFWDFFAEGHEGEYFGNKFAPVLAREVLRRIDSPGVVLDLGCGPGYLLHALRMLGLDVRGVDSSPDTIRVALERLPGLPEDALRVGSIADIPFPDASVDTVLLVEVVEHVTSDQLSRTFKEMQRVLRPRGHAFITTPNAENLRAASVICPDCGAVFHRMQHVQSWTVETLTAALLAAGFIDPRAGALRLVEPRGFLDRIARTAYYRWRRDAPNLIAVATKP